MRTAWALAALLCAGCGSSEEPACEACAAVAVDSGAGGTVAPGTDTGVPAKDTGVLPADTGAVADIIPADRLIDWTRAGVPGGVVRRTTACATITYSASTTDYAGPINSALAACPDGQVVEIGAGTFALAATIDFKFRPNVTLRGAGPEATILVPGGGTAVLMGGDNPTKLTATVTAGATKDSTSLTLSSMTNVAVGTMLKIDRDNDPALVHSTSGAQRAIAQVTMVTAVSGNTITIDPPLFWDFSANPQLTYYPSVARGQSIEDLKIDRSASGSGMTFMVDQCYGCWLSNIWSYKPAGYHLVGTNTLRCEVRGSLFDDSQAYGANNGGVVLYGNNTAWRIEDNVFFRNFPGVELQLASSANVIAYNYATDVRAGTGWDMAACDFDDNHGPHDMMNLYEGNAGIMFQSDGYFGSASHATALRNHFGMQHPTYPTGGNRKAVSLNRWAYDYSFVGNVLGDATWPADGVYEIATDGYSYAVAVVWQLGYPNMGNNSFTAYNDPASVTLDANVKATLLRHGNYDYVNKAAVWDPAIAARDLPASLAYAARPGWWPSATPWPPIGPDVTGLASEIPAQARAHAKGLP